MITVTETQYVEGVGDNRKEVVYEKYDGYTLDSIHDGGLIVYRSGPDSEKPPLEWVYYVKGSWIKVRKQ